MSKECKCQYCMVAVGAEGLSEIEDEKWFHEATKEEAERYLAMHSGTGLRRNESLFIDRENRPYFLIVLHDDAPDEAKYMAEKYIRVKRLID